MDKSFVHFDRIGMDKISELSIAKKFWSKLFVALFSIFFLSPTLPAQSPSDSTYPVRIWFNLGMGSASRGLGAQASINAQFTQFLITIHTCADIEFFGEQLDEYGFLIGWTNKPAKVYYSVAIGLARISTGVYPLFGKPTIGPTVTGFPIEAQLIYRSGRYFGFGLCAFFVASRVGSMLGVTITLQLGKFY